MELTTPIDLNISRALGKKSFFHKFFVSRAKDEIASKIRELRERRELTQKQFAEKTGMKQSAVSRIEQSDYAGWNFKTLVRVAEALDARLIVDFMPREDVIKKYEMNKKVARQQSAKSALEAISEASRNTFEQGDMAFRHCESAGSRIFAGSTPRVREPLQIPKGAEINRRDRGPIDNLRDGQIWRLRDSGIVYL